MEKLFTDILRKKSEDGKDLYGFTISSDRIDRQKERMNIKGANLRDFKKNPVMFYNHNSNLLPIGKWVDFEQTDSTLKAWGEFETAREQKDFPNEPVGSTIKAFVDSGFLNTTSIGFQSQGGEYKEEIVNGKSVPIYTHNKWDLLEASIVNIPANPDALRAKAIEKGLNNTEFLNIEKEIMNEPREEKAGRVQARRNEQRLRNMLTSIQEMLDELSTIEDATDYEELYHKSEKEKEKLELKIALTNKKGN